MVYFLFFIFLFFIFYFYFLFFIWNSFGLFFIFISFGPFIIFYFYFKVDKKKNLLSILVIYVDNILLAGNRIIVERTKELIKNIFKIKNICNVNFIIGIKFIKHKAGYFINQTRYIKEIIEKFEMTNATSTKNMIPTKNEEFRKIKVDQTKYRSVVGNLLYLSICTRPNIIYPVSKAKSQKIPTWKIGKMF